MSSADCLKHSQSSADVALVMSLLQQAQMAGQDWFFALVEHSSDLIVVINKDGHLLFANPAASSLFGIPFEEALGHSAFGYLHPDDRNRVIEGFTVLLEQPGDTMTDIVRFVSPNGDVRVLETVSTNCLDDDAIDGIVVNGRDVSERNDYIAKLEASFDAITIAIANMVELKDPYTAGHQREVAHIATAIAGQLSLPEEEVKGIGVASTIHDIGKIAIPAEILTRPGELTVAEFEIVKSHSQTGHDIVADIPFPWPVAEMILQHHERINGSGYPKGLMANQLLLGSRILAIADVVSAMSGHRPYRPALGLGAALNEIETNIGELYDPAAAEACLRLFRDGDLSLSSMADPLWSIVRAGTPI